MVATNKKVMASTMKLKFAGFLRGLLRHVGEPADSARPVVASVPPPAPAPETPTEFQRRAAAPAPVNATEIAIPLAAVLAHLPMDLKAKLMSAPQPEQMISVRVETIVQQLAFGSVKISFGELRRLTPGLFANSGGEHDNRQIALPLQEILTRLNPALLSRRPVQKMDVGEEIAGPFDGRGRGVTFTTQPLKAVEASPAVTELRQQKNPIPFTPPPMIPRPSPVPVPPRATTLAQSGDTEVFTFTPRQTAPPTAPIPFNAPKPAANGNGNGHAPLPPFKFTTAPASQTPATSSAPRPEPAQSVLFVALDELAENWPAELKNEVQRGGFSNVPLSASFVDAGLKRGRVTMTWKEIRTLAKPSSPASPHDALSLDLPLKVIAPAFFAAQKNGGAQKRLVVTEEIPNLFFGFPNGNAEPVVPPAPAPAAQTPADTNFFTAADQETAPSLRMVAPAAQTDFISRHSHPQEVVTRAMVLPGVAGAVVALADGLRVASQVPETLNADTVAAFLPQIFERVNQSTRELRMGTLNNVSFTVGNVPWKIFRVNSVYFAAFGRASEVLPKAQLAGLAAELDRKKQI